MKDNWKSTGVVSILLIILFIILLAIPVLSLIIRFDITELFILLHKNNFFTIFFQSVFLSLCAGIISVILALVISFFIREQHPIAQQLFILCYTIPIIIPTISLGMGIMYLFSRNGLLFKLLGRQINIFGFNGLLFGMVLYTTPYAVLQIFNTLRYEDMHLHNEAKALRLNHISRISIISLPRVKSVVKRTFFASFLISFTDFGINIMVGGHYRTLSLSLYQEIIGTMNLNRAALISICMWIPLFILFFYCMKDSAFIFKHNEKGTSPNFYLQKKGRIITCVFLILTVLIFLIPIVSFIISSFIPSSLFGKNQNIFQNYSDLFHLNLPLYLKNSFIISSFVSILGTTFSCLTAYVASKFNFLPARVLRVIAIVPLSVPGLVIGLGFVMSYNSIDFLFNTYLALISVNIINFFGIPYFLFLNNFSLMSKEIEITAKVFRLNKLVILLRVYLPQMKQTIVESLMFYFVNSMITISAAVIIFRSKTMPLSVLITQFEGQLLISHAAAVSTIIVLVNVIIKLVFYLFSKQKTEIIS